MHKQFMSIRRAGFTLVELLIVIVVIGILASITVVAYNGGQNRAYDATVQSDIKNFSDLIVIFWAHNQRYPNPTDEELTPIGYRASPSAYSLQPMTIRNLIYCTSADRQQYAFLAKSHSGNAFYIGSMTNDAITPFTDPWTSTTYAGELCTSPSVNLSASDLNQRTGYWPGHGDWQPWTRLY